MKTREALWRLAFGCGLGHYHRCGMVPGGVSWRQDGNFEGAWNEARWVPLRQTQRWLYVETS